METTLVSLIAQTVRFQRGPLVVLACLALLPPQPAVAQQSTPSPSAEELWESYPLHQTPKRNAKPPAISSPAAPATPGRPTGRSPAGSRRVSPVGLLALVGFIAGLGVLALPACRRRRETDPAQAATSAQHQVSPRARPDPDVSGSAAAAPRNPHQVWIAAIEWRQADTGSHFCVLVRAAQDEPGTVLADSGPLEWPPTTAASVRALGAAAEKLEASLVAAGWNALPSGSEWYAKRFSWKPVVEDPPSSPAAPRHGSRRFARRRNGGSLDRVETVPFVTHHFR